MKKIKRILFILTIFLLFTSITTFKIKASDEVTSENGKGTWILKSNEEQNLYGMTYNHLLGNTKTVANLTDQQVNVFSMKTDGVYSKLVNWACQSGNAKYKRATLDVVAKDYEETHPGWLVLGGINADQYAMEAKYINNVPVYPAPFYPLVMDGERRFGYGLTGNSNNYVGVTNDPDNPFVYESTIKGYYLYILDENDNIKEKFPIEGFNKEVNDNETSVWVAYEKVNKDTESYNTFTLETKENEKMYYSESADLAYVSNAPDYVASMNIYSGFAKGVISSTLTNCKVEAGQFAIKTTNKEVENALNVGQKVIVQLEYTNEEMNNVELSIGFHSAQRLNDKDVEGVGSYDTQLYSRSIFGRKADGTYVLVTIDMKTQKWCGMTQDDSNALLKSLGVVEAYQQDGGGSVCAVLRNEYGRFNVVNTPKDSSTRANFNGLLFVVRDPGYKVNTAKNTRNSIEIIKEENVNTNLVKNMVITVDGKNYPMTEDTLTISGLNEDTTYTVTYTFDMLDETTNTYKTVSYSVNTKTKAFQIPNSGIRFTNINKTSVTAVKSIGDYEIKNVILDLNGFEYEMGSNTTFKISNLINETKYDVTIKYTVVDYETGKEYQNEETTSFSTLSYSIPEIKEFYIFKETKNQIIIKYSYSDDDNVQIKASIVCNGTEYLLEKKIGNLTIPNLDTENELYELQLVISYKDGKLAKSVKSEVIKAGKGVEISNSHTITYELDGGTLPSSAVTTYVEGTGLEKLPTPTKDGYKFDGWYDENDNKVTSISKTDNTDITLYAKWTESKQNNSCSFGTSIKYLITFSSLLGLAILVFRKRG